MPPITSFIEFWQSWQPYRGGRWIFRGVSDAAHRLIPKGGRDPNWSRSETHMLDLFVREGASREEGGSAEIWEQLAIAQHHGLPTRLLDWSENPLVAAYFACAEHYDRDAAVYIASIRRRVDPSRETPFEMTHVARYRPRHISKRIQAQWGLFTLQPNPTIPLDEQFDSSAKIHRYIIRADAKRRILWDLERMKLNSASLFPDLAGLAANISWSFSDRDPGYSSGPELDVPHNDA